MNIFADIGLHLSGLEQLRIMMSEGRLTGIEQTLGLRIVAVEDGRVVVEGTPVRTFTIRSGGAWRLRRRDPRQCLRLRRPVQDGARPDVHHT